MNRKAWKDEAKRKNSMILLFFLNGRFEYYIQNKVEKSESHVPTSKLQMIDSTEERMKPQK